MKKIYLFLCVLIGLPALQIAAADVEVEVHGIKTSGGKLRIGVFDSAESFRKKNLPQSLIIEVKDTGIVKATVKDLKPGTYAIAVIHDVNDNEELDVTGRFKIPTEPYGFSNNPRSRFGPPNYDKCTFTLTEKGGVLKIVLK